MSVFLKLWESFIFFIFENQDALSHFDLSQAAVQSECSLYSLFSFSCPAHPAVCFMSSTSYFMALAINSFHPESCTFWMKAQKPVNKQYTRSSNLELGHNGIKWKRTGRLMHNCSFCISLSKTWISHVCAHTRTCSYVRKRVMSSFAVFVFVRLSRRYNLKGWEIPACSHLELMGGCRDG